MPYGRTTRRGGEFNRIVDPSWRDPLDVGYSTAAGGRWNEPGSFGALYLNAALGTARLQVRHKLAGQPFQVEDLDPAEQHDLVTVVVEDCEVLDCVSDEGLSAVGLPVSYPAGVSHAACRPIGAAARADGRAGVACRSAAAGAGHADEELAVFDTALELVRQTGRVAFRHWFLEMT